MSDVKEKTTIIDGVEIDVDGVIVQDDKQISEFDGESLAEKIVFNYRINCGKEAGKVLVGTSKTRAASIANVAGVHEFDFTFVAFKSIRVPDGYALLSTLFTKEKEWGHIIGIDSKGRVFSSYCKTYALGAFQDMITGFIFDVQDGKVSGSLVGKMMRLNMGMKQKVNSNEFFQPTIELMDSESLYAEKAVKVAESYRNNTLNYTPAQLVKI
jgi:hypothetical protein